jgi:hypothetical protein
MTFDDRLHQRRAERIQRGREASDRINSGQHFGDWVAVADALVAMREEAMEVAHTNRPQGPPYRAAFKAIEQRESAWASKYSNNSNSGVRAHCYWLIDNLPAVQSWRETLAQNQRDEWNHPSAVKRNYERMNKAPEVKDKGSPVADAWTMTKATIIRLQEENDLLRKKAGGGLMPSAGVDDVATALFEAHNPAFIRRLVAALTHQLEAEARQDAIERKREAKAKSAPPPAVPGAS